MWFFFGECHNECPWFVHRTAWQTQGQSQHHMMNHPICNHGGVLFKCHNQSSIPSICVLVPAPEGANPPVQPNMELNVPSNDHSPRPATLGIHPSIEFCRHPITTKPLPSTQVWHGLQKSMLVRLRYGVQLQQWLTHIHSSIFTWMCMMLVSKPLISPTTTLVI